MTEQDNATLEAEIEEKTGENAPRKAKNFWPSAKRLLACSRRSRRSLSRLPR